MYMTCHALLQSCTIIIVALVIGVGMESVSQLFLSATLFIVPSLKQYGGVETVLYIVNSQLPRA